MPLRKPNLLFVRKNVFKSAILETYGTTDWPTRCIDKTWCVAYAATYEWVPSAYPAICGIYCWKLIRLLIFSKFRENCLFRNFSFYKKVRTFKIYFNIKFIRTYHLFIFVIRLKNVDAVKARTHAFDYRQSRPYTDDKL